MRNILILFVSFLFANTVAAQVIAEAPVARSSGNEIILSWRVQNEAGVFRYDILRRAGTTGDFLVIGSVTELKGNNSLYEYLDRSAFKTSDNIYHYKIRIINGEDPSPETPVIRVSHISSAAKRTWGSIKAMFR